jgi:hypothetical protein
MKNLNNCQECEERAKKGRNICITLNVFLETVLVIFFSGLGGSGIFMMCFMSGNSLIVSYMMCGLISSCMAIILAVWVFRYWELMVKQ